MIVRLDPNSKTPPYEQVKSGIARRIRNGSLAVGTKLPTVRALAAELGIAPNTIARAYRELEEVGLLETKGRAGTFVGASGDVTLRRARDAAAAYAEQVRALGLSADEALAIVKAALET
ncbi:GntR family transcriptional regulator [Saccharomonospora glauca]|jgi:DNA-binding transcriptional regulator YhcF (GntR family)|uniref:Putative transcriptional regulator n=1 Tax=Saccharomonospora glauca K62 TaxID=928724 RepID=I1CY62_9PSEU|nr:GntR family transcriptional regulator [Saccharomonospora glauca]EIE97636.1 putative transcriptional regulator [Saccharomonospora glauca K62]